MARIKPQSTEAEVWSRKETDRAASSVTAAHRAATRTSPRKRAVKSYQEGPAAGDAFVDDALEARKLQPKSPPKAGASGRQRRLAPLQATSLSKPLRLQPALLSLSEAESRDPIAKASARSTVSHSKATSPTSPPSKAPDTDGDVDVEVEESVWCGSDASSESEDELPSPRKFLQFRRAVDLQSKPDPFEDGLDLARRLEAVNLNERKDAKQLQLQPFIASNSEDKDTSRPTTSSDKENNAAILRFSPPRLHSPTKTMPDRPVTPPQSPAKSRLQSPIKTKTRIPSPKLRQSLDAFWNAETVNEWNDQYSPRKILKSPRKLHLPVRESSSPTASPGRIPTSPSKRATKVERQAKRAFADRKHALADAFLTELDDTITAGEIRRLASSIGGVRIIWSKMLNSTAGRANWRRETTKTKASADGPVTTTHKHHASIELAEKVIDDEDRLLNVIAHEFCHLANFMVSGIKDQPHGKQFKEWGRRVTKAFGDRGVEVTTKHTYEIEYKYIWRCQGEDCGSEFKRHSKSIDPKRHTCGQCRGKLLQIKPTPRAGNASASTGQGASSTTGFAAYVKLHFAATKASLPTGTSQKAVMEALGKAYRAEKQLKANANRGSDARDLCGVEHKATGVAAAGAHTPAADVGRTGEGAADGGVNRLAEKMGVIVLDDD